MPPSMGVDWYRLTPDSGGPFIDPATRQRLRTTKRPFRSTPVATSLHLAVLIGDAPNLTIADIRDRVRHDPELVAILDDYCTRGHGHLTASDIFDTHNR